MANKTRCCDQFGWADVEEGSWCKILKERNSKKGGKRKEKRESKKRCNSEKSRGDGVVARLVGGAHTHPGAQSDVHWWVSSPLSSPSSISPLSHHHHHYRLCHLHRSDVNWWVFNLCQKNLPLSCWWCVGVKRVLGFIKPSIFSQFINSWILLFSCPNMTRITNLTGMTLLCKG